MSKEGPGQVSSLTVIRSEHRLNEILKWPQCMNTGWRMGGEQGGGGIKE